MNKKLAFAVIFFSTVTISTLTLSIRFLQKIYMLTSKKSSVLGIVLGIILAFIVGAMIGLHTYRKKTGARQR